MTLSLLSLLSLFVIPSLSSLSCLSLPFCHYRLTSVAPEPTQLLQVGEKYGYTMQRFFDLIQRTGEEMGIMSLEVP